MDSKHSSKWPVSVQSLLNMDKKTKSALQSLLKSLADLSISRPFREPVNTRVYPDYLLVIPSPIDLKTIRKQLNEGGYEGIEAVRRDVKRMFENCRTYTPDPQAGIRVQCEELEKRFDAKWSALEAKQRAETPEPSALPAPKKRKRDNNKAPKLPPNPASEDLKVPKSEVTYEEELNLDEGRAPAAVFESVIKFAVPVAVERRVVVVPAPLDLPVKPESAQLPCCEAYIQEVLSPFAGLGDGLWAGRIESVLGKYGYEGIT